MRLVTPVAHPAVTAESLAKTFRTSWGKRVDVLHDVSLEIPRGEIFGLLGPNGAGKTTTIKILLGFMRPSWGRAQVLGEPVGSRRVRARIGYLPENPYFYEYLTAVEFLQTCASLASLPRRGRGGRVEATLERVGLDPVDRRRLGKYSKGMLQRVGLAQAILHDPELILLDEPMSGLDPHGRRQVRDLLLELKGEGKTLVFCSHILPDVEALADRVGILVLGRLRRWGRVQDLVEPGQERFEVEVSEAPDSLVRSWKGSEEIRPSGDRLLISVDNAARMEGLVRQILGSGARLRAVKPVRASLEEVFLQEIATHRSSPARGAA